ncbi:MAG: GAF domain-containing protein [Bacteroidota bacterium]
MDTQKKHGRYTRIVDQLILLLSKTDDPVARMATIVAVLSHKMEYFFWCGFYRVIGDKLVVGPYQGPVACQVLEGKGVCWAAVNKGETVIVPDVEKFSGHISCDSRSKSEIVIPVYDDHGKIVAVLDVDSKELDSFDETDRSFLENIVNQVYNH